MKIAILLTCHNRKEKTVNCIKKLCQNTADISFIVVDDGSSDGTIQALFELRKDLPSSKKLAIIRGDGNLFYSGGMRLAMEHARNNISADIYMIINDDVEFEEGIIDRICESGISNDKVYVGAMKNTSGNCSYGGVKYIKGIHYTTVTPESQDRHCDTFNANCVVIPCDIFKSVPIMDSHYIHSLGDFDYGLSIGKSGYSIEVLDFYAGTCDNNPSDKTWRDTGLSRIERIRKKESVKGAPFKPWFYFLKKNFGITYAIIYSLTPYIRILIGK